MSPEVTEHLMNLVKSPGWLLFREHCRQQWGADGYGRRMKQALAMVVNDPQRCAIIAYGVDTANTEINAVLSWPETELRKAQVKESAPVSLQRGGA